LSIAIAVTNLAFYFSLKLPFVLELVLVERGALWNIKRQITSLTYVNNVVAGSLQ
jgi:hypothetical protein